MRPSGSTHCQWACKIATVNRQLFDKDRPNLFWVFHLGGWIAWGLVAKYLYTVTMLDVAIPNFAAFVAAITLAGMLISLGLRYVYRLFWNRTIWVQVLAVITGSAVAGYIWLKVRSFLYFSWIQNADDMIAWKEKLGDAAILYQKVVFVESHTSSATIMLAWSALYFAIKSYRVFQEVRESALTSAAQAHEAQLKMLRYQLNPHFLFNTLNAISTLILEQNTEQANRMVTKLSSFLRFSLDNDPMQRVTLAQEIKALELYLDIEKVRFEDRLTLQLDIDDEANDALIPSLLLQPLIENAVKYGIARAEGGGKLVIAAKVFAGDLLLELSDDGPGCELVDGQIPSAKGVGLRNTRERLATIYGITHSIQLCNTEPHGLTIHIRIPYTSKNSQT